MRILLVFLILIFTAAFASREVDFVDQVRTIDLSEDIYRVTFWGNNKVFKFAQDDRSITCLKTAYQAQKEIRLVMDSERKILKCHLFSDKMSAR